MAIRVSATERAATTAAEIANDLAVLRRVQARHDQLRALVAACEAKYGIASADIHAALDQGRLVETDEVCDWIIAHETRRRPAW